MGKRMSTPIDELRRKFSDRYMRINRYQECMMAPLPHFLPAEQLIFCEWIHEYEQWGEYFFDLPLYPDLKHWEGRTEKEVLEAMKYMLALKIDAIRVESSDEVSIIEVKRRGLTSGIGQLLVYRERFIANFPEIKVRDMIYVTTIMSKELEAAAKNQGIKVYTLPWLGYLGVRYKIGGG